MNHIISAATAKRKPAQTDHFTIKPFISFLHEVAFKHFVKHIYKKPASKSHLNGFLNIIGNLNSK